MNTSTTRAISGLILALVVASHAFGQAAPRRSIEQIKGDVYRATNNNHGTVFLVTAEGIILADPITTDFAMWLKEQFRARFDLPVRYVLYSHHHWDHATGGRVFADTAQFVGHANMLSHLALPPASTALSDVIGQYAPVAELDTDGDGSIDKTEAAGMEEARFAGFDANEDGLLSGAEVKRGPISLVRPPDITYTDEMEIRLGGKRVKMTWVGEMNHSLDSSMITFPDESVMFVVDFVTFGRLPHTEMDYELGRFEEWMAAISEAEEIAKDFEFVATGHGPVGTRADVTAWREYFEKLRAEVAAGIAAGHSLEEMQRSIKMEDYSHWAGFDWVDENVLGMYHFLTD